MPGRLNKFIKKQLNKRGWLLVKQSVWDDMLYKLPADYAPAHLQTYQKVKDHTMAASERVVALCNAVDYIEKNDISGDIAVCGVWRGGMAMAAIDTLQKHNSISRDIYLYDTFEGMITPAHPNDVKRGGANGVGQTAAELYSHATQDDRVFCYSSLDEVTENINKFNYPAEKVHYVKGMVEDTIPATMPKQIALLYFSISFYESVLHALTNLFPLLAPGGVLIISDYGDWEGTQKAVDEYIEKNNIKLLLNRIDSTGRIGVKIN